MSITVLSTLSIETTPGSVSVGSAVTVYEIPFFVNEGSLTPSSRRVSSTVMFASGTPYSTSFALTDSVATLYLADVLADFTTKLSLVSPVDLIVTF